MRFLADESCDFSVVRALRNAGFDVRAVAEETAGLDDASVMRAAVEEERLLLTEDKDFGWLVFASSESNPGVVLIRFPAATRSTLVAAVLAAIRDHGPDLVGGFSVLQPGQLRSSRRL
ncbi:MAG: DUF5615 family PIN-like protein [Planctomycetes bacterium]|nr:DUF5615 family PIN-like protein [Planctomycetota bacterium]